LLILIPHPLGDKRKRSESTNAEDSERFTC